VKNHAQHRGHEHKVVAPEELLLRNVAYTLTHDLVRCQDDGFYGWIEKEES